MKYTKSEMLEMAEKHSEEMFKLVALDCLEWLGQYHDIQDIGCGLLCCKNVLYIKADLSEAIRAAIKEVCK